MTPTGPTHLPENASPDDAVREVRFEFTGSGGEYFSIWIVNLLLSILTLGIYSAWAKVRREQYFCRNTLLEGHAFDYTGPPLRILAGRVIALVVVVAASLLQDVHAAAALGVTLFFAVAFPWVIVRSLRFRARHTRYRNLSFHFEGQTLEAMRVFLWIYAAAAPAVLAMMWMPDLQGLDSAEDGESIDDATMQLVTDGMWRAGVGLTASFTLLVALWPAYQRHIRAFVHRHLRFGSATGGFDGSTRAFYQAATRTAGIAGAAALLGATVVVVAFATETLALLLLTPALWVLARAAYSVHFTNVALSHASIGGQRLRSFMQVRSYAPLQLGNLVLLVSSLGLAAPWVRVREARYRLQHSAVMTSPDAVDAIVAAASDDPAAIGDEAADFLDFDVSL